VSSIFFIFCLIQGSITAVEDPTFELDCQVVHVYLKK
jgi:hypothetical protein